MNIHNTINDEYFEWLSDLVCKDKFADCISYRKLLTFLHMKEFIWMVPRDANRASDGIGLRRRFCNVNDYDSYFADYITGPCSVLEMMIALAIRCEENIMDDTRYGDRTKQWFWGMVTNMGLGGMYDVNFDRNEASEKVNIMLKRRYPPTGEGGLFTVKGEDIRKVEIWVQLLWYLDTIA